jgi:tetratricopeptide (TPR) repeat protein
MQAQIKALLDLAAQGNPFAAAQGLRSMLASNHESLAVRFALVVVLLDADLTAEALAEIETIGQLHEGCVEFPALLALARERDGMLEEAARLYETALEMRPTWQRLRFHLGLMQLSLGDYEKGWQGWEFRRAGRPDHEAPPLSPHIPRWDGRPLAAGTTLLALAEQGYGDTVQFSRFVTPLAAGGVRVVLGVQPSIRSLISSLEGNFVLLEDGEKVEGINLQCSLLDLPGLMGCRVGNIPTGIAYLKPPSELLSAWQQRLGDARRLRIGIAFSGNPKHANDKRRSIPAAELACLCRLDAEFYVLQNSVRPADAFVFRDYGFHDHRAELTDFAQTAALAACMDAIVSVDTSLAHVAAAIGLRTFVLLPFVADWRWLVDQQHSPWYPTATLLRQKKRGSWGEVLDRLCQAISQMAQSARASRTKAEAGRR